jgi:zinc transport system substrate-binding protein
MMAALGSIRASTQGGYYTMKRLASVMAAGLLLVTLAGCGGAQVTGTDAAAKKVNVSVSFYPLYEWTKIVGGDRVQVTNLVPPGVEPHEWEPSPSDMTTLSKANLFIYNGAGLEHWVEKTLEALNQKDLVAVEASKGFNLLKGHDDHDHDHGQADQKADDHEDELDPHIWLDPEGAIHAVKAIRDGLIKVDPAGKATYEANAQAYIAQIQNVEKEYESGLATCKSREIFVTHEAYGYLANRFHLEQHAILGLAPEEEPDPKTLQQLVQLAKEEGVKYVFTETVASNKLTEVLAKEVGAKTLQLHTFENLNDDERKAGANYLSIMKQNLANLKTALECGN